MGAAVKGRLTIISPKRMVSFEYPDDTPNYRRGFTPAGSAKLHFDAYSRMGKTKIHSIGHIEQIKANIERAKELKAQKKVDIS